MFYGVAASMLLYAYRRSEWRLPVFARRPRRHDPLTVRVGPLLASLPLAALAFITFGGNTFTPVNLTLWILALVTLVWAFWLPEPGDIPWYRRVWEIVRDAQWQLRVTPFTLALLAAVALTVFYRFYRLGQVPPEMFSDHAEKLTDVSNVLQGQYSIFFPRNTGRELLQMYLTAAVARVFNTGLSFITLKIGTAIAGIVTLPFIYLLGKEVANRRVGLYAFVFAGMAYWPNVISRVALRFTLYPLFVAPTLYFLIRGLRRGNRNDFILAGIALGLGLHGYSPFRLVPLVVVAAVALFIFHRDSRGLRPQAVWWLVLLALVSLFVFLPLFRYALDNPEMFSHRALTRLGSIERPLTAPFWRIFLSNLWDAMTMFFWSNGDIWVHSVTGRPALGVVSAALFALGSILVIVRYLRKRTWLDLFLLVSVPLLLLPSILSLAFPDENPSLNRTGGAIVPVFLFAGLALDGLLHGLRTRLDPNWGRYVAGAVGVFLLISSASQNYDLVFDDYYRQFRLGAWNTSEIGHVIRAFADSVGDRDSAWVVPFPHWVDTRLVGINAGFPGKDYALWPEQFGETLGVPGAKLFVIKPEDGETAQELRELYPQGSLTTYESQVENKDFWLYLVPPDGG
jgi:hypothetical protein